MASFEKITGLILTAISDYCSGASWTGITLPPGISAYKGSGLRLLLGVNPAPDAMWSGKGGNTTTTWNNIVAGLYDAHYIALAQYLVSLGFGNAILRIAWEFGAGQPWQPVTSADPVAAGIGHIATVMKGVSPSFLTDANPVWGWTNDPEGLPPNVDIYSVDIYDQSWNGTIFPPSGDPLNKCSTAQSNAFWNDAMTTNNNSVMSIYNQAKAAGKGFAIPETSTAIRNDGHGLGDDPQFFVNEGALIKTTNPVYVSFYPYVDSGGNYDFTSGAMPNVLASFRSVFG